MIGVDLSAIQPSFVPGNLCFEIDDMSEAPWTYPHNHFSYIHVRGLYGCIRDWPAFYHEAYASLEPGGWFEQGEISVSPISDDDTVTPDHIFTHWGDRSIKLGDEFGKTFNIYKEMKGHLESSPDKWDNVIERTMKLPIGAWAKDPQLKKIGAINKIYWEEGIEGWSMALLTRLLHVCYHP